MHQSRGGLAVITDLRTRRAETHRPAGTPR